jgi:hypothetical protein
MINTENNQTPNEDESFKDDGLTRNAGWEKNHASITKAMSRLIIKYDAWPTKADIATESGLSLSTVCRHMEHFGKEDMMAEELKELKFMTSTVFAVMVSSVIMGNMKAMRLALEVTGALKKDKDAVAKKKDQRSGNSAV